MPQRSWMVDLDLAQEAQKEFRGRREFREALPRREFRREVEDGGWGGWMDVDGMGVLGLGRSEIVIGFPIPQSMVHD